MKNKKTTYLFLLLIFIVGSISPIFLWNVGNNYTYIYRPLIWLMLLGVLYLFIPKKIKPFSFRSRDVREITLIAGLVYILVYYLLGIAIGYAHSPYNRSFLGIIANSWAILGFLIPREIIRNYFIKLSTKKNKILLFVLVTITMTLTDVSYGSVAVSAQNFMGVIEYVVKTFLPLLVLNTFLTYLVSKDNHISSLIYILVIKLVSIITPVFPNNIFFLIVLIDFLVPFFTFIKIENAFNRYKNYGFNLENSTKVKIERFILIIVLIVLLTFTTRLLPYMPTVIVSNSMLPQIKRGDMVIIKRKEYDKIQINDIIEYKLDNVYVVHRIIKIKNTKDGISYITKGDNNRSPDAKPVKEEQITGKVVLNIPSIGYPTILIREFLEHGRGIIVEEGVR